MLCSIYPCTRNMSSAVHAGGGRGGGDESLCFVFSYPVTRSAQAPGFFLARIRSDCCMQTAVVPVSTYMQSAARPAVLQ